MCQNHNQLKVLRTYGIELEGYTDDNIRGNYVSGWKLTDDGSLSDGSCECDDCGGGGSHECSECWGSGDQECSDCCGGGEVPCSTCDCSGEVECEYCDGEGGHYEDDDNWVDCLNCLGNGKNECPTCEGSQYVECESCDGRGRYECNYCDGNGNLECESCDGRGSFDGGSEGYGVECISGVLNEGDYEPINQIFDYINRYDWSVNDDCGTHVHIGSGDLQATDLAKLAILGNIVEPMIYGTLDSQRINGTYSKKTRKSMIEYFITIGSQITLQQVADKYYDYHVNLNGSFQKYDHVRYYGINLHSHFYRNYSNGSPTVEFRYFEGCNNKEQAKGWVDLCVKLVDFAKHTSFEQLQVIGSTLCQVDSLQEYIEYVKELLGLEYNFKAYSNYAYNNAKENVAEQFRTDSTIERAV